MNINKIVTKQTCSVEFLTGIIDYAGFFPPARLDYIIAFENFLEYSKSDHSWMLSRFISPTSKIKELKKYLKEKSIDSDMSIVAILQPADDINKYIQQLASQLKEIDSLPKHVSVSFIETKVPKNISPANIDILLEVLRKELSSIPYQRIFIEVSTDECMQFDVNNFVDRVGIKVRCGGPSIDLVPSVESLAKTIMYIADNKIPVKYTAGLHHPILHFDPTLGGLVHGFLNVFMASMLAYSNRSNYSLIESVLSDQDPSNFIFDKHSAGYKDKRIHVEDIQHIRQTYAHSFGTCSFDDPIMDLTSLGII